VEQALDSVAGQTFGDFELIITDDCSPDGTAERITGWLSRTGFPARFLRNEKNLGICRVRNQALSMARGTYLCSLAGDDWYEPDRLVRQCGFFSILAAEVGFIYSDVRICGPDGAGVTPSYLARYLGAGVTPPEGIVFERLLQGNFVPAPGVMIRRAALEAAGGYDESLAYEDYDMWLKLAHRYPVRHLPGIVANYRELDTGMMLSPEWQPKVMRSTIEILSRWLGNEPAHEAVLARRIREASLALSRDDRPAARKFLRQIRAIPPRLRWRAVELALAVPGSTYVLPSLAQGLRLRKWLGGTPTGR
jgi:cellulose synthase/poly-beta-1,6-N-acetylglucosamine synthase-like glycosyltransferase